MSDTPVAPRKASPALGILIPLVTLGGLVAALVYLGETEVPPPPVPDVLSGNPAFEIVDRRVQDVLGIAARLNEMADPEIAPAKESN